MTKHANISAHATNCLACRAGGGGVGGWGGGLQGVYPSVCSPGALCL